MAPTLEAPPLHLFFHFFFLISTAIADGGGRWETLQQSIGVSAMHMQLLHNDRVIIFDRTDFGPSNLSLPAGRCRRDPADLALPVDCSAHSVEFSVLSNSYRPLTILSDTWCSSATVAADGALVQTGGYNDGSRSVRTIPPCDTTTDDDGDNNSCDWSEMPAALAVRRWYATNQILPDGRAIIVGGRGEHSYEFYPKLDGTTTAAATVAFGFLAATRDPEENNLYPFVHLSIDGNLFIFANNRAILLDYHRNAVIRRYPTFPGGDPRNYPSSGSSVLLPLGPSPKEAEVLICGGAPTGSYLMAKQNGTFVPALSTCGRIKITDRSPIWTVETMPMPRVMGDMVLLPTGCEVAIINGAMAGTAGWELGHSPAYAPVIYHLNRPQGSRFELQAPATTARLYHSTALLLRDGRVLVGGSNPHMYYNFTGVDFPTELSLEAFSPEYLSPTNAVLRPRIILPAANAPLAVGYGEQFRLVFALPLPAAAISGIAVSVTMVAPAFATHAFSMNQRLLILETQMPASTWFHQVVATAPASPVVAPAGYYMVFVVNAGIPSEGVWVHLH